MSSITTDNVGDRRTTVFSQNISSTSKPRIPEKLLKQPHSFDPTKHEIHSWVSQFKDNISSWGVGEDNYYNILKQYVPDQYKDMVHGWSGDAWNVIEGKLVAFFGNKDNDLYLKEEIKQMERNEDETIHDFIERFNILWDKYMKARQVKGLKSSDVNKIEQFMELLPANIKFVGSKELTDVFNWHEFTTRIVRLDYDITKKKELLKSMSDDDRKSLLGGEGLILYGSGSRDYQHPWKGGLRGRGRFKGGRGGYHGYDQPYKPSVKSLVQQRADQILSKRSAPGAGGGQHNYPPVKRTRSSRVPASAILI
jgi:hypothetical protein